MFIPVDKIKKLRDSSRSGDPRAKKILDLQMNGEDFSGLMDEFFAQPAPEQPALSGDNLGGGDASVDQNPKLMEFLSFNKIGRGNPEYDSFVADFYRENPHEKPCCSPEKGPAQGCENGCQCVLDPLIADEIEAISGYQEAMLKVLSDDGIDDTMKKGIIADLDEIKRDEIEHLDKLKRMKSSVEKKEEKAENPLIKQAL